jgi:hypothetical protein
VDDGSSSTAAAVDANAATTSRHGEALIEAMGRDECRGRAAVC